jgi:sporulation protein YlmC with PRC-barrel domain
VIRFSDIAGNPVMDTSTATTVGRVEAPISDPATHRIVGFRVKKSKGPGDVLLWEALAGLGPDALTVSSAEQVADAPDGLKERSGKKLDVLKRRVLTEHGHPLGKVRDIEFDPADGRVTSLLLKDSFVDGTRLLGIGKYAVVVTG